MLVCGKRWYRPYGSGAPGAPGALALQKKLQISLNTYRLWINDGRKLPTSRRYSRSRCFPSHTSEERLLKYWIDDIAESFWISCCGTKIVQNENSNHSDFCNFDITTAILLLIFDENFSEFHRCVRKCQNSLRIAERLQKIVKIPWDFRIWWQYFFVPND